MAKKNRLLIAVFTASAVLLSMDCTCVFASMPSSAALAQTSGHPGCHAQKAADHPKPGPVDSDCCGKCKLERSALLEKTTALKEQRSREFWLYDPFLADDVFWHGRADQVVNIPVVRSDLLYHQLTGANGLARSPPSGLSLI